MDYSQEYEELIDLKDVLFHVLKRWRSMLLAAVVMCVLAGSYALIRIAAAPEAEETEMSENQDAEGIGQTQETGDPAQEGETEEEPERIRPVKYVVFGFAGGIFVTGLFYAVVYAVSDKIRGERELREKYGYYLLGVVPKTGRKRFLSFVDGILARLEGTANQIPEAEAYRIIAANIANLSKEGQNILVTGTVEGEKLSRFMEKLPFQAESAVLVKGEDMSRTASTLEKLHDCDAVVFVEERDGSLRKEIRKEQESIAALGKPVLGYVLL